MDNLHLLQQAGIPHDIAADDRRFWFVVQEGCDLGQSDWNVDRLTDEQASMLLDLISGFLGDGRGWDLVGDLRKKLGMDYYRD